MKIEKFTPEQLVAFGTVNPASQQEARRAVIAQRYKARRNATPAPSIWRRLYVRLFRDGFGRDPKWMDPIFRLLQRLRGR